MKKIIIIDDDAGILDALEIVFNRAGYAITMLNNPTAILENKFEEPDIFLIDKQLNGMDGIELCRHLKQRIPAKNTPVLIFSASTNINRYAKEAGADDFIEKPFKSKDLLAVVERLTTTSPSNEADRVV